MPNSNASSGLVIKIGAKRASWWKETMQALLPDLAVFLAEDDPPPESIRYAVVWRPQPGWLAGFPNLDCIISVGAGVEHILCDPDVPKDVPIIRTVGPDLRVRMREYVTLHVLRHHRRLDEIVAAQPERAWHQIIAPPATERHVGILGLGNLGGFCAEALIHLGFQVSGWSRSKKFVSGMNCLSGNEGLHRLLSLPEILVCLLPLTPETEGILNAETFARLPRGAAVINAARGEHLVEGDLLAALDSGQVGAATLDVFRTEPLPDDHPFWDHPNVLVTPHIASLIDPEAGGRLIAENLNRFRRGEEVPDMVDVARGY